MVKSEPREGRWTAEEQQLFEAAFEKHGGNWQVVSAEVPSRSAVQCRSHAQKCLSKRPRSEECVVAERPHRVMSSGPVRALSQASQYGESVRLAPVLEEEDWKVLIEAKRLSLPLDPDSVVLPVTHSLYSLANRVETSLRALPAREVRTVSVQYVKTQVKTQEVMKREPWHGVVQWMKHGKREDY